MSNVTETPPVLSNVPSAPQSTDSKIGLDVVDEKAELKALLAEARNTKVLIEELVTAVRNASFQGHQMLAVAKGVNFLDAILNQNKAHIKNLQERINGNAVDGGSK